jgi:hypothetical protein
VACPFFMPTSKFEDGGWTHPTRLPLGGGWRGHCCAPGHEGNEPTAKELREWCNLGYALACSRRSQDSCDALRFAVVRDSASRITVLYSCESKHRPAGHGTLDYDLSSRGWAVPHPDARIQKMAECFLESYLSRRSGQEVTTTARVKVHEK